jgi:hypothetical protein
MALENIRTKLTARLAELEAWAELSGSSDFPAERMRSDTAARLTE